MCNLNFLIKTNSKNVEPQNDLLNAYNSACFNSFIYNNDNEGFYFDYKNSVITSEDKINLFENKCLFENSRFILGHQRFTTSGRGLDYAQPFKKNGFVFIHNGVVSDYAQNGHSDTYNLFNAFLKHYERYTKKFKNEIAIKKAIEKVLKNKYGSFSIGIFDIKNQNLYYFKNNGTDINAVISEDKKLFYLSTASTNIDFLRVYDFGFNEFEINDDTLYLIQITKRNKISIKSKGKLTFNKNIKTEFQKEKLKYENENIHNIYNNYTPTKIKPETPETAETPEDYFNLDFFKKQENIKTSLTSFKCESCGIECYNTKGNYYGNFCDYCLVEMEDLSEDTTFLNSNLLK